MLFSSDIRRPGDELIALTHTVVGALTLRIGLRDDSTMICFRFRHDGDMPPQRSNGCSS